MKARGNKSARRRAKGSTWPRPRTGASNNLIRGRFKRARLPEVEAFSASLPFDRRLYRHDIRGSIAHARMLARVGLLSSAEARKIIAGLEGIEREIDDGRFRFDVADEDIHLAVERRLIEKIGAPGRKLHTARSRNDQVALDLRLYLRDEITEVIRLVRALRAGARADGRNAAWGGCARGHDASDRPPDGGSRTRIPPHRREQHRRGLRSRFRARFSRGRRDPRRTSLADGRGDRTLDHRRVRLRRVAR